MNWRTSTHSGNGGATCVQVGNLPWRTSSYSSNGGDTCVEVASLPWRTSSHSSNGGNTCVETASTGELVAVRDTTDRGAGPVLAFTPRAWATFTTSLKH